MPNRIFREGFLRSHRVHMLSPGANMLYTRLFLVADDYGRFAGSPTTIRAACWPLDPDKVRPGDVSRWITETLKGESPLIKAYNVNGIPYVEIQNFRQAIRSASKYPNPPWFNNQQHTEKSATHDEEQPASTVRTHAASPSSYSYSSASSLNTPRNGEAVADSPEKPKRTRRAKRSMAEVEKALGERLPGFNRTWEVFPCRDGKLRGMDAYERKVNDRELAEAVYRGAVRYAKRVKADPTMKLKYFEGWVNDERWNDAGPIDVIRPAGAPSPTKIFDTESITGKRA